MSQRMEFDVHLPRLMLEMVDGNPAGGVLRTPLNIAFGLLTQLTARAIELDDPKLNALMLRLALYEVSADDRQKLVAEQMARIAA